MTRQADAGVGVYRALLRLYPADFQACYADQLVQLFGDQLREARTAGARGAGLRTWLRTLADLAVTAVSEHARRNRTMASLTVSPSSANRALGLAGIVGGAFLLAAWVVDIDPSVNTVRIVLFNIGAIAVVVAVHRRQVSVAPVWAWLAAVPAILANAAYLVWILLAIGRPFTLAADLGLVGFYAGVAMWLTDAWFGLVTARLGAVPRWVAVALAIGSVLAVTGITRLGLTSSQNPTIFDPLSQVGAAANGIGWILLGFVVATRRRALKSIPEDAAPSGRS